MDEGGIKIDSTSKKLPIATLVISLVNIAVFTLAFIMPRLAFGLAVAAFVIFIIIICIMQIFKVKLIAYLDKSKNTSENIIDDSDKEMHEWEKFAFWIFVLFVSLILLSVYQTWRKRLFGLLISSFLAICVIVFSGVWALGQNMITFLYIVSFYLFLRVLVAFTLNPFGDNKTLGKVPKILKVSLEIARIFFIGAAVISRDGTFMMSWMPPSILESVVATIAIDSIFANFSAKKEKQNETDKQS